MPLEVTSCFKILSIHFSWLTEKYKNHPSLKYFFSIVPCHLGGFRFYTSELIHWLILFLHTLKKKWFKNSPPDFKRHKPHYYRWYVDDIFVLFTSPEHLDAFWNFLNDRHANMSFRIENGKQNRTSFPDVQDTCEDRKYHFCQSLTNQL